MAVPSVQVKPGRNGEACGTSPARLPVQSAREVSQSDGLVAMQSVTENFECVCGSCVGDVMSSG